MICLFSDVCCGRGTDEGWRQQVGFIEDSFSWFRLLLGIMWMPKHVLDRGWSMPDFMSDMLHHFMSGCWKNRHEHHHHRQGTRVTTYLLHTHSRRHKNLRNRAAYLEWRGKIHSTHTLRAFAQKTRSHPVRDPFPFWWEAEEMDGEWNE